MSVKFCAYSHINNKNPIHAIHVFHPKTLTPTPISTTTATDAASPTATTQPLPLRHDRGEITLTPVDDKTRVVWISEGQVKIPFIGSLLSEPMSRRGEQGFLSILKQIERDGTVGHEQ